MAKSAFITIATLAVVTLFGAQLTAVSAQTNVAKQADAKAMAAVEKIKSACRQDLTKYCSTVTPGDGHIALCVLAHEDKISDQCFGTIFDVATGTASALGNVSRAADACDDDAAKLCGNVDLGDGRLAQCLIDNKSKLATSCSAEISGIQARLKK